MICIKNGNIHDGLGHVETMDILIENGHVVALGKNIEANNAKCIDATGKEIFPGFIDTVSDWGVMGPGREIRGNANDNDEKSDNCTPEMDVIWAVNGRGMERQQLPAWGITTVGVTPSNSNVFGGKIAAYQVVGKNPMKMCLKEKVGMKASVSEDVKNTYGTRQLAPMTKMGIFSMLRTKLREAQAYDPSKEGVKRDPKLEALKEMLDTKMPLFINCNTATEIEQTLKALEPYNHPLVFLNGYGVDESLSELVNRSCALVVTDHTEGMNKNNRHTSFKGIMELYKKGMNVAFSSSSRGFGGRENLLWTAIDFYREVQDAEAVCQMLTHNAAVILGIDDQTGSIEVGKRADLVIWSDNPITSYRSAVEATFVKGQIVYQKGDDMKCFL